MKQNLVARHLKTLFIFSSLKTVTPATEALLGLAVSNCVHPAGRHALYILYKSGEKKQHSPNLLVQLEIGLRLSIHHVDC